LTTIVTALFGLAPAVRASSVTPLGRLKGSDDAHSRGRLTRSLIGVQMTFCVFVLFVTGLLVTTFANLSNRPLGFEHERLLLVDALTGAGQSPETWAQLVDQLRSVPGVESVAQSMWPPLSQNRWTATVRVPGSTVVQNGVFMLGVSPEYFATMGVGMVGGRTFRAGDVPPRLDEQKRPLAGVGIINEAMARVYFNGENPIGKRVSVANAGHDHPLMEIVGVVRDSAYYSVREPMRPIAYVPLSEKDTRGLIIRASGDPVALVPAVRRDLSRIQANFRATSINPFSALVRRQLVLERLLAILSLFFAMVALLLAGIGLYGVLNYAVIQRRREIGVRMALGARAAHVVRRVTSEMLSPVGVGTLVGLGAGLAFGRLIQNILFEVTATDAAPIATPLIVLAAAACLAALPPALRAVRTDPAQTLRSE
jgi:predicted permease